LDATTNISQASWIQVADRCNKDFFKIAKGLKPRKLIKELLKDGVTLTDHNEISDYIYDYYRNLYQSDSTTEFSTAATTVRSRILQTIPMVVSPTDNDLLTRPFTTLELKEVVDALARGKASGLDGIPIEFF
jgi:hypothetical protein